MENASKSVLQFDGVDDVIDLGQKAEHKIKRDITLEAWINPARQRELDGVINRVFHTGSTQSGYALLLDGKSGFYAAIRTVNGSTDFYYSSGTNTVRLNEWQHIAATYDGKQVITYVNGERTSVAATTGDIDYDPDHALTIGAYRDNNEFYPFHGKIAEVRIWQTARTQEQIKATMSVKLQGDEADLVGSWSLDEGSGGTAKDRSKSGIAGQLTGGSWDRAGAIPFGNAPAPAKPASSLSDEKLAELSKQLAEQHKKIGELEAALAKCGACEEKIAAQEKRIAELAAALVKCGLCDEKISALEAYVAELEKRIAKPAEKVKPAEPPKPAEPDVTPSKKPDDLSIVEGIGPKITELLAAGGITTFQQLATADVSHIKSLLAAGGGRFRTADPTTWPEQARLAAAGKWDELTAYKGTLRGGR